MILENFEIQMKINHSKLILNKSNIQIFFN